MVAGLETSDEVTAVVVVVVAAVVLLVVVVVVVVVVTVVVVVYCICSSTNTQHINSQKLITIIQCTLSIYQQGMHNILSINNNLSIMKMW